MHGVVGGGEDGLYAVVDQLLGCLLQLIDRGAGALDDLEVLGCGVLLGLLDSGCRGILAGVVEQADSLEVGVLRDHQVDHGRGVEVVRGAGDVGAGRVQRLDQAGRDGVGHGRKDDGGVCVLGRCLHAHGNRGGDAHHGVDFVGLEVRDDLRDDGVVCVAVFVVDVKGDVVFLTQGVELFLQAFCNLVEGCVIHVVAQTDLVGSCGLRGRI